MKYKDYYQILGVGRQATAEDIKKAYRRLARKYHPDVSKEKDAEERFKDINAAHDILGDSEKRAAYDQLGSFRSGQEFRPPPDWGTRFGQGGFRADAGGMDMSDLFSQLFGMDAAMGRRSRGFASATKGRDVEAKVALSLEEAFRGVEKVLHLSGRSGREAQSVKVRIPAGTLPGRRLRVTGKGEMSAHGHAGDLYIDIAIEPHPFYRLEGKDISIEVPITPWEAVLGANVLVPSLSGSVRLRIPGGARGGQKLRITGRGMPAADGAGDFYAVLRIVLPTEVGETERQLYAQLAAQSDFDPRPNFPRD